MNRDFKGIWIPQSLIDIAGSNLALKLCAFHLGERDLSRQDQLQAVGLNLLEEKRLDSDEVLALLCKKRPQNLFVDHSRRQLCPWCNGTTVILHSHHFPVPKSKGGKDTVNICPNCHCEYHCLMEVPLFVLAEPYASEINEYMEEINE